MGKYWHGNTYWYLALGVAIVACITAAAYEYHAYSLAPHAYQVLYTDKGFSPALLSVPVGSTVTFKNTTHAPMLVASDPNPTHTDYPEFVAGRQYGFNESYTFTFDRSGTFGYDNDEHAADRGFVQVSDPAHPPISIEEIPPEQQPVLDHLLTLFKPGDPNSIFTVFDAIAANPALSLGCHELGHALGHRAYEMYGFSGAMTFSNPEAANHTPIAFVCSGGYMHGILEEVSAHQPELIANPKLLCANIPADGTNANLDNCYHGVGHALMFAYERNLTKSVDGCRLLGNADFETRCFRGVYMELFLGDTEHSGPGTLNWDPTHPLAVCQAAPSDAKPSCFLYSSFGYMDTHPGGVPAAIQNCTSSGLSSDDEGSCIAGIGVYLFNSKDFSTGVPYITNLTAAQKEYFYEGMQKEAYASGLSASEIKASCNLLGSDKAPCVAALAYSI